MNYGPIEYIPPVKLTYREHLIAVSLNAILINSGDWHVEYIRDVLSKQAILMADSVIKILDEEKIKHEATKL